ncbi:MAG: cysteine desulfurase family protein [Bifidobacterium psychraerophilum]|uniref:cysteine desulfurase family protein n=1 Tax=Bifidobacterium psychraerophilum TaxID=218140 RepID=UPI0039E74D1B
MSGAVADGGAAEEFVYLDAAATEAADPEVVKAMLPYMIQEFGNPSSVHTQGKAAASVLRRAREEVASRLGARAGDVIFTSGGTESDNLAIKGIALGIRASQAEQQGMRDRRLSLPVPDAARSDDARRPIGVAADDGPALRREIVISAVEHSAVRESARWLERNAGFRVIEIPVDGQGHVDVGCLKACVGPETALVSVMLANNEVGTIQPISRIAEIAHAQGAFIHTDAVQAAGLIPVSMRDLGVDAISLSGHKFGTPKGIGALIMRSTVPYEALISGGGQEHGIRSGTENVAGAVALAVALNKALEHLPDRSAALSSTARRLTMALCDAVPEVMVTGDPVHRLPGHVSLILPGVSGEALLVELDAHGISCSSGSACAVGRTEASPTLLAMGFDAAAAKASLRMTFRSPISDATIDRVAAIVKDAASRLNPHVEHVGRNS